MRPLAAHSGTGPARCGGWGAWPGAAALWPLVAGPLALVVWVLEWRRRG